MNFYIRTRIAVNLLLKFAVNHAPQNRTLNHFQRRLFKFLHNGVIVHLRFHVIIRDGTYLRHKFHLSVRYGYKVIQAGVYKLRIVRPDLYFVG